MSGSDCQFGDSNVPNYTSYLLTRAIVTMIRDECRCCSTPTGSLCHCDAVLAVPLSVANVLWGCACLIILPITAAMRSSELVLQSPISCNTGCPRTHLSMPEALDQAIVSGCCFWAQDTCGGLRVNPYSHIQTVFCRYLIWARQALAL